MDQNLDLYEFPSDHIGRKSYVTVRGHSKMIPKFKTYKGSDGYNYLLPEYGGDWSGYSNGPTIMRDKAPYLSPLDGTVVEGRAAHREHMNRHNVYEAGDTKIGDMSRGRDNSPLPPVAISIKQAMEQLRSR